MSQNTTNYILSPGRIWISPVGEALPADTVAFGTALGGNWTLLGNTKEAVVLTYGFDTFDIMTQQMLSPVGRKKVKETLEVKTSLAEYTGANLAIATDGTFTQVTAATGVANGVETVDLGGKVCLTNRQICVEALVTDDECQVSLPLRWFVWNATVTVGGDQSFSRDDYAGIPLTIAALALPSKAVGQQLCQVRRVTPKTTD
jgi:hypothetical protein